VTARRRTEEVQRQQAAHREQVAAMYRSGMNTSQIAAVFGCSRQAISHLLRKHGVIMRPRGGNTGSHSRHRK
jgi:DNA-binding CsgD family transcriptional regulator